MGEDGEPDWTFVHPSNPAVWIEFKKPGESPEKHQLEFMAKLQHLGYRAGWADSYESFLLLLKEWGVS